MANPKRKFVSLGRPADVQSQIRAMVQSEMAQAQQAYWPPAQHAPWTQSTLRPLPEHIRPVDTHPPKTILTQQQILLHVTNQFLDHGLTPEESNVAVMVLRGYRTTDIAARIVSQRTGTNPSEKTIKAHISAVFRKFGVSSRSELFASIFPL